MRTPLRFRPAGLALLALPLLPAFAAAVQTPTATATITYHDAPVRGYRVGDDFMLPLDAVTGLSWSASRKGDTVSLIAEGHTLSLPVRKVGLAECISMKAVARGLNALTNWLPGFDAYEMMAPVGLITARDGKLRMESGLPVRVTASVLSNPPRVVVDLEGGRYLRATKLGLDVGAKVVQYRPNTTRIIYELPNAPAAPTLPTAATEKLDLDLFPAPPVLNPVAPPVDPAAPVDPTGNDAPPTVPLVSAASLVDLRLGVQSDGPTSTLLSLGSPAGALRASPTVRKPQPDVLEIVLPGLQGQLNDLEEFQSEAVTKAESRLVGKDTVVRLELASAMGGEVWSDARGVSIQLLRPAIANGKVAGKVVVVDAGHGGRDSGCKGGGVMEKALTLAIAKYTAAELANLGATVLMTRKDDSYPTLDARSALANRNRADLFISIHINSPGGKSPIGGTEIYYHMKDGIARLLGECIMSGMQQYAKLPNLGVKSDRILYRSGLAVLRNSKMTSVLVEVGFITNARDRAKMTSTAFQQGTAQAIAFGVQKFLGAK